MAQGTNAIAIGNVGATAPGVTSIAIGPASSAGNTDVVAIGNGAASAQVQGIAIGLNAAVSGAYGMALGTGAAATVNATALGKAASAAAASSVAIGDTAATLVDANGNEQVAVGSNSLASKWRCTAVGAKAQATETSATAIGRGAVATATHAVALGRGAFANAANSLALGFSGGNNQTDVFFASCHTSKFVDPVDGATINITPTSAPIAIHGYDALDTTASPTNDVAGGPLLLCGGRNTGTAIGGSVKIQTSSAGGVSNNTKAPLVDRLTIDGAGLLTIWDGGNLALGTTTGTKIGTVGGAAGQKLGFWNAAPIVQPVLATGGGASADNIITVLQNLGLVRQS